MAGPLAIPSFVSGPKNSLAAPDIYTVAPTVVINNIQPITALADAVAASSMLGGSAMQSLLKTALSAAKIPTSLSVSALTNRISNVASLKSVASSISSLSSSGAAGLLGSISQSVSTTVNIGGVISKVASSALSDVSALSGMINSISGVSGAVSIVDKAATVGVMSGIVNQAVSLGVNGAYGAVTAGITDTSILNGVAQNSLYSCTAAGDITSVSSMASSTTPGALATYQPGVVNDISQNFLSPFGTTPTQNYGTITDTFNTIDPNWNTTTLNTTAGPVTAVNITGVQNGSSDFNAALTAGAQASDDPSDKAMLAALSYPKTTVSDSLTQSFPTAAATPNTSVTPVATDPTASSVINSNNVPTPATVVTPGPLTINGYTFSIDPNTGLLEAEGPGNPVPVYVGKPAGPYHLNLLIVDGMTPTQISQITTIDTNLLTEHFAP
jgi:hypothetical protein